MHDGLLYPLPTGILFMKKPFMFIAAESISEFVFGRGGSAVGRTVDVVITTDDGDVHEFGMIDKVETEPLRHYAAHLATLRERAERRAVKDEGGASGVSALSGADGAAAGSSANASASTSASAGVGGDKAEGAGGGGMMDESDANSEDAESDYDPEVAAREESCGLSDDDSDSGDSDDDSDDDGGSDGSDGSDGESDRADEGKEMEKETEGTPAAGEERSGSASVARAPPARVEEDEDEGEETEDDLEICRVPVRSVNARSSASAAPTLKRDEERVR